MRFWVHTGWRVHNCAAIGTCATGLPGLIVCAGSCEFAMGGPRPIDYDDDCRVYCCAPALDSRACTSISPYCFVMSIGCTDWCVIVQTAGDWIEFPQALGRISSPPSGLPRAGLPCGRCRRAVMKNTSIILLDVARSARAPDANHAGLPYRKSNPEVLMVQASEVQVGHDAANSLNSTRCRCILVQR
jgi:hypothetical protein